MNKLVQAVTVLTCIVEALCSILGRSTNFVDRIFMLYSVRLVNGEYVLKLATTVFINIFSLCSRFT
jgi:flagellar biosynthesis protein FliQ